ncbi:MAG: hypothetical protein U5L05_02220 [Rubrivivax sp.]|nr:hypothetical protein [Rubrivivax sp.]
MLVTPFLRQMYAGMVPGRVTGHRTADQCAIALAPLAQAAGVRLIEGSAEGLGWLVGARAPGVVVEGPHRPQLRGALRRTGHGRTVMSRAA